ncbi:hypothetical protein WJX81_000699 [Elliptochloris bilobata]|uniref:Hexosyltransferase n=1 Tax=Elliptochloris bilobata TaxID=381761 RepID=A0AAW1RNH2_9CHLO
MRQSRHAFVTSMRSADYLMGLRELQCSLNRTNPGVPLIVLGVEGDLDAATRAEVSKLAQYRLVEDIVIPNQRGRYFLNWVKLRAWEWDEWDALILLDADALVRGDLTHLFSLPTNFAWASQNGHTGYDWNRGGVIMMRPCKETFDAMLHVVQNHEYYKFKDKLAEQDFLSWFFKYTMYDLPMRYNLNFQFLDDHGLGPGGTEVVVLHFADSGDKEQLFHAKPGSKAWPYLCHQPAMLQGGLGAI